jgi:hypothetical protein
VANCPRGLLPRGQFATWPMPRGYWAIV